jgi:hypothetical protein
VFRTDWRKRSLSQRGNFVRGLLSYALVFRHRKNEVIQLVISIPSDPTGVMNYLSTWKAKIFAR